MAVVAFRGFRDPRCASCAVNGHHCFRYTDWHAQWGYNLSVQREAFGYFLYDLMFFRESKAARTAEAKPIESHPENAQDDR